MPPFLGRLRGMFVLRVMLVNPCELLLRSLLHLLQAVGIFQRLCTVQRGHQGVIGDVIFPESKGPLITAQLLLVQLAQLSIGRLCRHCRSSLSIRETGMVIAPAIL